MSEDAGEDRPLPAHILRALDAVVNGPGRVPTTAHPMCICGDLTGEVSPHWVYEETGEPIPLRYDKADCPIHKRTA